MRGITWLSTIVAVLPFVGVIREAGVELYLTEVKGPVMDRLSGTDFLEQLGSERVFLTTEEIYEELASSNLPHG